ncbi:MAG: gliding motility-associated C-terminal domain-containing protein [Saprospirales bacterium]|nr:gliding motility-associated C-terminal domain-containing protein [Saprospirales bacterium]
MIVLICQMKCRNLFCTALVLAWVSTALTASVSNASAKISPPGMSGGTPPPSVVIHPVPPLCFGQGDTLRVTLSGQGPWTFDLLANGMLIDSFSTGDSLFKFAIAPQVTTTYTILDLQDATGSGAGAGLLVQVNPAPSAVLQSDTVTHCAGPTDTLRVRFSGPGPYTLVYSVNGVPQAPLTTSDTLYSLPVTATLPDTTVYTLDSVGGGGCPGMVSGVFAVVNIPLPKIINLKLNCAQAQGTSGTYRVEFDVAGGTPPFTLLTGFGTFTGTHFVSTNIPAAQGYKYVFHDAVNCGNVTVTGLNTCFCTTYAGTMVPVDSLTGCIGTPVTVGHNGNQVLDADDIFMFVLHTEPGLTLGTVIDTNYTEARFEFNFATMGIHVNYWISAIAGNNNGSGGIDPNDPCFSMTPGIPVHWHLLPTVEMDTLVQICPGEPVSIPVELRGSIPREFTYTKNGQPNTIISALDRIYLTDTLFESTLFLPVSVHDLDCPNSSPDTAEVRVHQPPAIAGVATICNPASPAYVLEFDVVDADLPSVLVSGSVSGTYNPATGHFRSDPIPKNLPYTAIVRDTFECGVDSISGAAVCNCLHFAGVMHPDTIEACAGDTVMALHYPGVLSGPGDSLVFILHTGPGTVPGTVLSVQNTPVFGFGMPGMLADTLYYISAVAGSTDSLGNIVWDHPCLSVSPGTPVRWHPLPTAALDTAGVDICAGAPVSLPVQASGTGPFLFFYTVNGLPAAYTAVQSPFSLDTTLQQAAIFQSTGIQDAFCSNTATGQAQATVHTSPLAYNVQAVCQSDNLFYTVEFDIQQADLPSVTISGPASGTYNPTTGHFTSAPIPVQDAYLFSITDAWGCTPTLLGDAGNCPCSTSAGIFDQTPLVLCLDTEATTGPASGAYLDANDTLFYLLTTAPAPPVWSILASNAIPSFAFDPAVMTPETTYYMVAVAGNKNAGGINPNDPCTAFSLGPAVVWKTPASAMLGGDAQICQGDSAQIWVHLSGTGPFELIYSANGVLQAPAIASGSSWSFSAGPTATTLYELQALSSQGCPGSAAGTAAVTVFPTPEIVQDTIICSPTDQSYVVEFHISNGAAPNPAYVVQGLPGTLTDSVFVSAPIPSGQSFAAQALTPEGCQASISGSMICLCLTKAGALDAAGLLQVCLPANAVLPAVNNAVLEDNDTLVYVLYPDDGAPASGAIAWSAIPEFGFLPGMQTGRTYFITAAAGNKTGNGGIDLNDPCLSFSPAVPVIFHNPPVATLAGDTAVCAGAPASFNITFGGVAPFSFQYAVNGIVQAPVTAFQSSFNIPANNLQQTQVFTLVAVQDAFCNGTAGGAATVSVLPAPMAALFPDTIVCHGTPATLRLQLSGSTLYDVVINGGAAPIQLNGVSDGATVLVMPAGSTTYSIGSLIAPGNGCPAEFGPGATVQVAPPVAVQAAVSNYNGFAIRCAGGADGSIDVVHSGGVQPVNAVWSTGAVGVRLQGLPAGSYTVTLTDGIGCTRVETYPLTAPEELLLQTSAIPPLCAGEHDGMITLESVQGGVPPFAWSVDNGPAQPVAGFPEETGNLHGGAHNIRVEDANGCTTERWINLADPPALKVFLREDTTLLLGDSILLTAVVNHAIDTFAWSPTTGLTKPYALSTAARPVRSTRYQLWVWDMNGCADSAAVLITVFRDRRIFIPNILKPGASGENGSFTVYCGPEVQLIRFLRIYNRWGECLFDKQNFAPNLPALGWQGTFQGQTVPPGAYLYVTEVELPDGSRELLSGNITVMY